MATADDVVWIELTQPCLGTLAWNYVVFTVLKVKSYNKNYSQTFLCVVSAYCRYLHIIIVISLWNIKINSDVRREAMIDQGIMYIKWRDFDNNKTIYFINLAEKRISSALSEFLSSPIPTLQVIYKWVWHIPLLCNLYNGTIFFYIGIYGAWVCARSSTGSWLLAPAAAASLDELLREEGTCPILPCLITALIAT